MEKETYNANLSSKIKFKKKTQTFLMFNKLKNERQLKMTMKTYNFNIILNIRPVFSLDINIFKTYILGYSILYLISVRLKKQPPGYINIQM